MSGEFENYKKTYSKVHAVAEQQELDFLLEVFKGLWKNKNKSFPIFPDNSHLSQIKELKKLLGEKTALVIEHYFTLRNDWFEKQGYSLGCLIKNISQVNASYHQKAPAIGTQGPVIRFDVTCNPCGKKFILLARTLKDLEKCPECEKENKPFKFFSKSEREAARVKCGLIFLDMPEDGV